MIRVIGDWYITVDESPINYVVRHGKGEKGKKGQYRDKAIGYFSGMSGALDCIRRHVIAERLSQADTHLDCAIRTIRETDKELREIFESVNT